MAGEAGRGAAQEQLERRRLARLIDVLPVFSGFVSSDGHITQSRPATAESYLWALPEFAYAPDSVTQIVDLCERAARGERIQVERPYLRSSHDTTALFARGLLTLTPVLDDKDRIDELAVTLIDCDENGLTPPDPMGRTRLATANSRIDAMLSLAQTVIESAAPSDRSDDAEIRERMTERLDMLASIIDIVADPDREDVPVEHLLDMALANMRKTLPPTRLRHDALEGLIPIASAPLMILLLHELAANAQRHGAWRPGTEERGGQVMIQSEILDDMQGRSLRLHWIEDGGTGIGSNIRRGFGFEIAEHLFAQVTGGRADLFDSEDGVSWSFELPVGNPGDDSDFEGGFL